MSNNHSSNGSFNAFLWGLIIGGGAVFLLGTKKGKKILKAISEEGLELSELFLEEEEDLEEQKVNKVKHATEPSVPPTNGETGVMADSVGRRFFRGISKRS